MSAGHQHAITPRIGATNRGSEHSLRFLQTICTAEPSFRPFPVPNHHISFLHLIVETVETISQATTSASFCGIPAIDAMGRASNHPCGGASTLRTVCIERNRLSYPVKLIVLLVECDGPKTPVFQSG